MPEDASAVLDAPELEAEEIEGSEGREGAESTDGTQERTERQEEHTQDDEPSVIEADGKLKLSGKALETLNKLKAENPKQAREFRAALFDAAAFRKHFPEGARQAEQLTQELEEYGGLDGVTGMKGELDAWKGLDADWTGNKPQFAAEMAESNPDAFAFHAPHVMAKYAEVDPAGFTHNVSKVFAQDMAANEIPLAMKLFLREIQDPNDPTKVKAGMNGILEVYNALKAYTDRVNGYASKAPEKKASTTQPGAQGSEVDQREQALTVREFNSDSDSLRNSITESEFNKNLAGRKISAEKVAVIQELYESALKRAVRSIPKHDENSKRYLAAKDRAGYKKYMDKAYREKAPAAMAAAFRKAGIGDKPGPKKTDAKPGTPGNPATPTAGFNRVGAKPNHNEVDWQATARIAGKKGGDGKYIMRDGSKVLFQR